MLASIELTLRTAKTVCKYFLYAITVSFVISLSLAYTANAFTSRIYFSIVAALLSPNTRYFLNSAIIFAVITRSLIAFTSEFFLIFYSKSIKRKIATAYKKQWQQSNAQINK